MQFKIKSNFLLTVRTSLLNIMNKKGNITENRGNSLQNVDPQMNQKFDVHG
jgi:hypothetical protein